MKTLTGNLLRAATAAAVWTAVSSAHEGAFATEKYVVPIGQATWVVKNLGASGSDNCIDLYPAPAPYYVGQDAEYHYVNGGYPDFAKDGTYIIDVPCALPAPILGKVYGYGSPNVDIMVSTAPDSSLLYYAGQSFYNTLKRSTFPDFTVYVSNGLSYDGGWTKMKASEFVAKFDNGDYAGKGWSFFVLSTEMFNDEIHGGAGNDQLATRGGNDSLYGEEGNDILSSFDGYLFSILFNDPDADTWGAATLAGGLGDDVYYLKDPRDKIIEDPGEGFDIAFCPYHLDEYPDYLTSKYGYRFDYDTDVEVIAGPCVSLPPNFTGRYFPNLYIDPNEVIALNGKGTSLSDAIKYYEASITMDAGSGDDLVVTGSGDDAVAGGVGNDIISSGPGNDQVSGGDGDDIVVDTEGSTEPSSIAPVAARALAGIPASMAGVPAGPSGDFYDGGTGLDTIRYSVCRENASVSPQPDGSVAVVIGDSRDVLMNVERLQFNDQTIQVGNDAANKIAGTSVADKLFGFGGNDTIAGNGGNDAIDGGEGADIMSGGDGDDSYVVDNAGDKVKENARPGSGTDTVYTSLPAYTMPANVENLVYTGATSFSGKGNKSANRMTGGPAADTLDGQKGTDVMIGLGGDDTYVLDSPADLVTEEPGGGIDAVISGVSITTLNQNVEVLTLKKGNINGRGNEGDNVIVGSSGQNVLEGGDGADTLIGGLGNDTFYGETSAAPGDDADTVSYAGAKKAIVFSLSNTAAGQNTGGAGTDRIYEVSAIENLTGSGFNDLLTGSMGPNVISGADGNDTIAGLAGADVLVGGKGLDLIDCGADAEADRVVYALTTDSPPSATLRDQVANFTPGTDLIDLSLIDANAAEAGDQAFAWGGTTPAAHAVWYSVSGTDLILAGDVNGDAVADIEVLVKGVQSLQDAAVVR